MPAKNYDMSLGSIHIRLFGRLRIETSLGQEIAIRPSMPGSLLAILAATPSEVTSRDVLVRKLWPNDEIGDGRARLRITLKRLMDQLEGIPAIISDRDMVSIDWARVTTDLQQFNDLLAGKSENLSQLDQAIQNSREILLSQYNEPWVETLRVHIAGRRRTLSERFARIMVEQGSELALPTLEEFLRDDRTNTTLARQWVEAYRRENNCSSTVTFEAAVAKFGAAASGVFQSIIEPEMPVRDQSTSVSFLGRETEQLALDTLLDQNRLVTVVGVGGAGKTRLATEFVLARGNYLEVDLTDADSAEEIFSIFARVLGVGDDGSRPLEEEISSILDRQTRLVFLDNCEHVVGEIAAILRTILRLTSQVKFLATSRVPLSLAHERVLSIRGLGYAEGSSAAYDFFQICVLKAGYRISEESMPLVRELIEQVDGLPLGIELAAAQLRKMELPALVEQLRVLPSILTSRSASARHRSLEEVIEWSIGHLSEESKQVLVVCSVFGGGFTREALAAVADVAHENLEDAFAELLELSLVHELRAGSERRYKLLETVKAAVANESKDNSELKRRHAHYYANLIERLDIDYMQKNRPRAFHEIDEEYPNVLSVFNAAKRFPDCAVFGLELCISLWTYFDHAMRYVEATHHFAELLLAAEKAGHKPRRLAKGYLVFGRMLTTMSRHDEALAALSRGRELATLAEVDGLIQLAFMSTGRDSLIRGDFDEALRNLNIAQEIAEKGNDPLDRGWAAAALGEFYSEFGYHTQSIWWNRQACESFASLSFDTFTHEMLVLIANSERNLGLLESAKSRLEKLADLPHVQTDKHSLHAVRQNLGEVFMDLGDTEGAERLFTEVCELRRKHDLPRVYALSCRHLGSLYCVTQRLNLAEKSIREAYEIQLGTDSSQRQAVCEHWLARVLLEQDRVSEAGELLTLALTKLRKGRNLSQIAKTLVNVAHLSVKRGDSRSAAKFLIKAHIEESRAGLKTMWYDQQLRCRIGSKIGKDSLTIGPIGLSDLVRQPIEEVIDSALGLLQETGSRNRMVPLS